MKRGKDDEKIVGPMFPRLHVNDTEKGGPRAPPRNKMALYEQLSIPSQRFSPGVLHLNLPPASSSQGNEHERGTYIQLQRPQAMDQYEKPQTCYSELSTSLAQVQQEKKLDEDDFRVPIFVESREVHCRSLDNVDKEKLSPFAPAHKLKNVGDKEAKRASTVLNSRHDSISQSEENVRVFVVGRDQSGKSASNFSSREIADSPLKQDTASQTCSLVDHSAKTFNRLQRTNDHSASQTCLHLQHEYRVKSQQNGILSGDSFSGGPLMSKTNGNFGIPLRDSQSDELRSDNDCVNDYEFCEGITNRSLQAANMDKGDDVSETSMVDSISGLDISPDDVVGIIGQRHFWKARKAIVNQQRLFAVQVFELHRLIKVQRLFAGSPNLLVEDGAYLGEHLKGSPVKKLLPLEHLVKSPSNISKHKSCSEKPNHNKIECSAENVIGKISAASLQNGGSQLSNQRQLLGNLPAPVVTEENKIGGPWCFHQSAGHQWLVPVMSPSEGFIYKPYPGPAGFVGPVCGSRGPPTSNPMMGGFVRPGYGVPAFHHHYQGMSNTPLAHPATAYGYFPPYGMPFMNHPAMSGSGDEQMNNLSAPASHPELSGGGVNFSAKNQSSCNMSRQKNGATSKGMKLQTPMGSELQASIASSPSEKRQAMRTDHSIDGRDALPLFPTSPVAGSIPEGASQHSEPDQPSQVIRVVPHNARSATESVARIFRSIQEERKQFDSV